MNLYLQLALHFICKKNSKILSFTSFVAICGIAFGVCAFLVVVTILNSFQKEMKHIILNIEPNLVVYSEQGISNINEFQKKLNSLIGPQIEKQSPFIYTESILLFKQQSSAIYLRAIDVNKSGSANKLAPLVVPKNAFRSISSPSKEKIPSLILGKELAQNLGVHIGDTVTLLDFKNHNFGIKNLRLKVTGIIEIGISQYDKQYGLMNFEDGSKLFGSKNWASGVEIALKNPNDSLNLSRQLNETLPYTVVPWQDFDKDLFHQVERDGTSIKLIVLIISFVGAFNIIITLSLTVIDRAKQIALLRSLGSQNKQIIFLFLLAGLILGLLGSTLGVLIGYLVLKIFSGLHIGDLQEFYYLEKIPVHIDFHLILIAFTTSVLLSFFGAIYPAWRATRVSPIIGLKQ